MKQAIYTSEPGSDGNAWRYSWRGFCLPGSRIGQRGAFDRVACEQASTRGSIVAVEPTCPHVGQTTRVSMRSWLPPRARNQEFRQLYALARQCQAEDLADEILKIADDSSRDYKKKIGADGKETWVVDREHIARCRLRIATRKRILAWMTPRKYGNS
jgi:hypothetical protein